MSPKGNTPTRMGEARELTPDEKQLAEHLGDQYELIEKLGAGGMGTVYKARLKSLQTFAAIKVVRDTAGDDAQAVKRLKNEAQALGTLQHPNIVRVMHLQQVGDSQLALVMEYIEGKDLAEIIESEGKLSPERARSLLKQCAEALRAAHSAGIIHRDLKPGNILVTESGGEEKIKILDFGIAKLSEAGSQKLTRTGNVMGSPAYMSPEQACAAPADSRSDIYSLGCVFYEALSGSVPFIGESVFDVLLKHANERVPELQIPDAQLVSIISKCTEPSPADRFQSAQELLDALGQNSFKHQASTKQRAIIPARKAPPLKLMITGSIVLMIALVGAGMLFLSPSKHSAVRAKLDEDNARRRITSLVNELHSDVYHEMKKIAPSRIEEIRKLEPAISKIQTAVDLGNAYANIGLRDDARRMRERVIAMQRAEHKPCNHEVARLGRYYLEDKRPERALQTLQQELAYEIERDPNDHGRIAKTYMDLALVGLLTDDLELQTRSLKEMRSSIKSPADQEFVEDFANSNQDALFALAVAKGKDTQFARELFK